MKSWQNIHQVVVVGLGITGLSVVKHLTKSQPNIHVNVIDTRAHPPGSEALPKHIDLHCGGWNESWLQQADLVVINPGVSLATPEIQAVIAKGTPVVGDIELFALAVQKPVIAITGSNGKSTVTDLTGVMANAAGLKVAVGGNIGVPALDLLEQEADLYVLELSSFQLETTSSLKLKAAAFLNLSEDHMDRYQGMTDYRQAKLRIFDNATLAVVNRDDRETFPERDLPIVSFGYDNQEFGLELDGERTWLLDHGKRIIASDELQLVGRHNLANALVVFALLQAVDIDYTKALDALRKYSGLTHRCQVVSDKNGVKWVNDSKATNVASTIAALSGLQSSGRLFLIVGGIDKGADVSPLGPIFAHLNLQLCCFGVDGDSFMPLHSSARRFDTLEEVVKWISEQTVSGDMVMLSPACSSFDQFDNFMARGDAFATLAEKYA